MIKTFVLFVGNHNAARAQMAEGLMNGLYGDKFEAYSAGVNPTTIDTYAVEVMSEIGIDISKQRAKNFKRFC